MTTYILMLYVSLEQETAIRELFSQRGWLYHRKGVYFEPSEVSPHPPLSSDPSTYKMLGPASNFSYTYLTQMSGTSVPQPAVLENFYNSTPALGPVPAENGSNDVSLVVATTEYGNTMDLQQSSFTVAQLPYYSGMPGVLPTQNSSVYTTSATASTETTDRQLPAESGIETCQSSGEVTQTRDGSESTQSPVLESTYTVLQGVQKTEMNFITMENMATSLQNVNNAVTSHALENGQANVETAGSFKQTQHVSLVTEDDDAGQEDSERALQLESISDLISFRQKIEPGPVVKSEPYSKDLQVDADDSDHSVVSQATADSGREKTSIGKAERSKSVKAERSKSVKNKTKIADVGLKRKSKKSDKVSEPGKQVRAGSVSPGAQKGGYNRKGAYHCEECGITFTFKKKFNSHKRNGKCKYNCTFCGKVFISRDWSKYQMHLAYHRNERLFKCEICNKSYNDRSKLKLHMRNHTGEKPYVCHFCGARFTQGILLRQHIHNMHMDRPSKFRCDICKCMFKTEGYLKYHMKFIHSEERPYVCEICQKGFKTRYVYTTHLATHEESASFKCEVCSKTFKRRSYLTNHQKRHKKEHHLFCELCGKGFYERSKLKDHARIHSGEKPYQCKVCDYRCAIQGNLRKHMKLHVRDQETDELEEEEQERQEAGQDMSKGVGQGAGQGAELEVITTHEPVKWEPSQSNEYTITML